MQKTSIGWTDFSVNLLKYRNAQGATVWACVHASEGCRFCYSEALAKRWGRGEAFTAENMKALTPYFDMNEANQVLKSKKITGKKVFVDDMTDLFGEWVSDAIIDQHFAVFSHRPDVTFQVLTKRAERMRDYMTTLTVRVWDEMRLSGEFEWPLANVHLGVSVEDQRNADSRLAFLHETPAAVKWASIEPLLGRVQFDHKIAGLDGIVIGGETGSGHREMPLASAISLAHKARESSLSVYVKQDSGPRPGMQGRIPDDVWAMKEWPSAV
jgi:protein gp37